MEIKRTIEISVEKTRRFVIRQPEADATLSCPACGELMLTAEAAAVLLRVKCRRVYQIVEPGAAHFVETETGAMFVCPPSLDAAIGNVDDAPNEYGLQKVDAASNRLYICTATGWKFTALQ